jgi:peptide/nickel transport system ATP-binding protein
MTARANPPLLQLDRLSIRFGGPDRPETVDSVSLSLARGEIVALVGESGSGKSLLAHTIAGILCPVADISIGQFVFAGMDLADRTAAAWRDVRGREIGIVFQNPRAALNPVRTVGRQIADVIHEHRGLRRNELDEAVIAALASVRIPEPSRRARAYAGELSGGMCQRVMIAIALAGNPSLLIADEPTTGLDTTTQAAILALILGHAETQQMATLFITHDLALARAYAQRIVVMHAGQIVEEAPTAELFAAPRHPYTAALIEATPANASVIGDLEGIPGSLPNFSVAPPACRFAERCGRAIARCQVDRPPLTNEDRAAAVACWLPL